MVEIHWRIAILSVPRKPLRQSPSSVRTEDDCLALSALSRIRSWHSHLSHEFKVDTPNRATKTVLGAAEDRSEVRRFTFSRRCCKTCGFWVGRRLGCKMPPAVAEGKYHITVADQLGKSRKKSQLLFFCFLWKPQSEEIDTRWIDGAHKAFWIACPPFKNKSEAGSTSFSTGGVEKQQAQVRIGRNCGPPDTHTESRTRGRQEVILWQTSGYRPAWPKG